MDPVPEPSTSWTMPLESLPQTHIRAFIVDAADQPFKFNNKIFEDEVLLDLPTDNMSFAVFIHSVCDQIFASIKILERNDPLVTPLHMIEFIYVQAAFADGKFSTVFNAHNWRRMLGAVVQSGDRLRLTLDPDQIVTRINELHEAEIKRLKMIEQETKRAEIRAAMTEEQRRRDDMRAAGRGAWGARGNRGNRHNVQPNNARGALQK